MKRPWFVLIGLACLPMLAVFARIRAPQDDLAKELPRIPATEPKDALTTFKLHEGFLLHLAASEPLLTDPVAAFYDADGRLYVVEMRGYPYADDVPPGNVRLLVDADGDGTFDRSTIFLNDLSWPTSVIPYEGGVFIAAPPEILYARDNDGDGVADVRRVVFRGFGTQNVQALLNGLLWGPDGWIYGAGGPNGGTIQNVAQPDKPAVEIRGRDFRFKPDGSAFEAISGGGQFGHTFDDWGHRFVCSNSNHIRQVVLPADAMARNPNYTPPAPTTDIAVEGGAGPVFRISPPEPWRVVRTRQRVANPDFVKKAPPSELHAAGFFTSATGVTIYRGTAYPPEYFGNAFVGDVGGNLVHRKLVEKAGPIYSARRADEGAEFLASTDNWFRPVNFVNTPSGTLMVLDMYRETIEHPASIPDPIKRHLDLTSGHDRGRLYEIVPNRWKRRAAPRLSQANNEQLVATLADVDAWWRETAQRLLIERNAVDAEGALRKLADTRPNTLGRVHALWTLGALDRLQPGDLHAGLEDPEPGVREQSALLAVSFVKDSPAIQKALLVLAHDPDAMVRFQAAITLGDLDSPASTEALAFIASQAPANDPWTRAAVLSGLSRRAGAFLRTLDGSGRFLDREEGRPWLTETAALVGAETDSVAITWLGERFSDEKADPKSALAGLLAMKRGSRRSPSISKVGAFNAIFERIAERCHQMAERAADTSINPEGRLEAVQWLELAPPDLALQVLPPLLDARQPSALSVAALRILGGLTDPRVGPAVVAQWRAMGPTTRREAAEVLFARKERRDALLDGLKDQSITAGDLETARQKQLLNDPDASLRERAKGLLSVAQGDRAQVVVTYREALDKNGDASRGRTVFEKSCATCHRAEDKGVAVGPDFVTVADRSPEDLLIHVLDPNREVAPNYMNYTVETKDGRVLSGMIADESAASVTLKRAEGLTDTVARSEIEAIRSTGQSLMPEGLEKDLNPQAMADLITFLRRLKKP
jgi:putative membrane-bound dehydrogenase-like protein